MSAAVEGVDGVSNVKTQCFVSIASDIWDSACGRCLRRNLELTGLFEIGVEAPTQVFERDGSLIIRVSDAEINIGNLTDEAKQARMMARIACDKLVKCLCGVQGFALQKIAFVRRTADKSEICVCYPDGMDIRQWTSDGCKSLFPRWTFDNLILYVSNLNKEKPFSMFELDSSSGRRKLRQSFQGDTGVFPSPIDNRMIVRQVVDGTDELVIADGMETELLTRTSKIAECNACWSPDGKSVAVDGFEIINGLASSQIVIIDLETHSRRQISEHGLNIMPDWSRDGKLVWVSKDYNTGQSKLVLCDLNRNITSLKDFPLQSRHVYFPQWLADSRHVVCEIDSSICIVDMLSGVVRKVFYANGQWGSPSVARCR